MKRVLFVPLAILHKFNLVLKLAVLGRSIVPPLAFSARQRDNLFILFLLASHINSKLQNKKALERNRTADHILTMDVLCHLSYKGIFVVLQYQSHLFLSIYRTCGREPGNSATCVYCARWYPGTILAL